MIPVGNTSHCCGKNKERALKQDSAKIDNNEDAASTTSFE